jgi:hypothetical protein
MLASEIHANTKRRGTLASCPGLVYRVGGWRKKFENGMAVRKGSSRTTATAIESEAERREARHPAGTVILR